MILVMAIVGEIALALLMQDAKILGLLHAAAIMACGLYAVLQRNLALVMCVIAYTTGSEVLWRQVRAPIFYLAAPYIVIALSLFAVLFVLQRVGRDARLAALYAALLLPAIIATIRTTGEGSREIISFALTGPIALASFVAFTSQVRIEGWLYRRVLWIVLISAVGPLTIAVSSLQEALAANAVSFNSESNFITSGGFGPVQVSSMLSLGIMAAIFLIIYETNPTARVIASVLAVVMAVQTLLTFSRGGSFSVGIAMAALAVFSARDRRVRNSVLAVAAIALALAYFVVFPWLEDFTQGAFEQRFSDTTTTRTELAANDTEIFSENIVLGVGAGMTKYQRLTYEVCQLRSDKCTDEASSHTEFTRMLSEHGIPGLIGIVILGILAWHAFRRPGIGRSLAVAWLAWTIAQMFYANLRIVAVPFAFGLAFLRVVPGPSDEATDDEDVDQGLGPVDPERVVGPSGTPSIALAASAVHQAPLPDLPIWDPATGDVAEGEGRSNRAERTPISPDEVLPPTGDTPGRPPRPTP
jgi:O-antigen ligase